MIRNRFSKLEQNLARAIASGSHYGIIKFIRFMAKRRHPDSLAYPKTSALFLLLTEDALASVKASGDIKSLPPDIRENLLTAMKEEGVF